MPHTPSRTRLVYDAKQAERDACGVGFVATTRQDTSRVLPMAIEALKRLAHRGGVAADRATGDGAGVMTQIPHGFFMRQLRQLGCTAKLSQGELGVGVFFVPQLAFGYSSEEGEIDIRPFPGTVYAPHEHIIMGNTALYGATGGSLFAAGRAGERFAVRNSGCLAVVEGVGDHACEYMTGGTVVILGPTGYNLAAGMTGGEIYVLDEVGDLLGRTNTELVILSPVDRQARAKLHSILLQHVARTGSAKSRELLAGWPAGLGSFVRITPRRA